MCDQKSQSGNFTTGEVKCFIGIVLLSECVPLPRWKMYWEQAKDLHDDLVTNAVSQDRFEFIMSNIYLANNDNLDKSNKFARF